MLKEILVIVEGLDIFFSQEIWINIFRPPWKGNCGLSPILENVNLILEQWILHVLWPSIRSWFICFHIVQVKGVKNALARAAVCNTYSQAAGTHQQENLLCASLKKKKLQYFPHASLLIYLLCTDVSCHLITSTEILALKVFAGWVLYYSSTHFSFFSWILNLSPLILSVSLLQIPFASVIQLFLLYMRPPK